MRIGASIEDQKTGVYTMRHQAVGRGQSYIHGVGVAAKIATRLKQRDVGASVQAVRHRQP